jgi:hypothetical protein
VILIIFESPNGLAIENPSVDKLREDMIDNCHKYWNQGHGSASISCICDEEDKRLLLVFPSEEYGMYLKYLVFKNGSVIEEWLSLNDSKKLDICIECSYEWYASIGLFLPKEKAWVAVNDFLMPGVRSNQINWIKPDEMPDDGNW